MVKIFTTSRYRVNRADIVPVAEAYLKKHDADSEMGINIIFVGTRKMKAITKSYKNEDEALPVLAFPYHEEGLLGEIFLCYPQVILLAAERDKSVDEIVVKLVLHGIDNLLRAG